MHRTRRRSCDEDGAGRIARNVVITRLAVTITYALGLLTKRLLGVTIRDRGW